MYGFSVWASVSPWKLSVSVSCAAGLTAEGLMTFLEQHDTTSGEGQRPPPLTWPWPSTPGPSDQELLAEYCRRPVGCGVRPNSSAGTRGWVCGLGPCARSAIGRWAEGKFTQAVFIVLARKSVHRWTREVAPDRAGSSGATRYGAATGWPQQDRRAASASRTGGRPEWKPSPRGPR